MLVGMGSAGLLESWFSCHEIEDSSCTAEGKAMVLVALPVSVVALGVLADVKVVLAAWTGARLKRRKLQVRTPRR
jgi:hypothetical protein